MTAAPVAGRAPETLILSGRDIRALMDEADWLDAVETAFRAAAEGRAESPPPMAIHAENGTFHAKGARIAIDRHYVALKLNGNFPDNEAAHGLPTIQGVLLLCDGETGAPLAIMDSIEVTIRRTAAASALAARHLARSDAATLCIAGCGAQGAAHVRALKAVLPLSRCLLWDRDADKARRLADEINLSGVMKAEAADDFGKATAVCDIIALCTTSRRPFLGPTHVRPGTFIAAVGADSPDKSEVEPALMAQSLVVADSLSQCVAMGDLHHAIAMGAMGVGDVHAELHEIVVGARGGRTSADQIILFDSTGTAIEDVAAAATIYRRARRRRNLFTVHLGMAA